MIQKRIKISVLLALIFCMLSCTTATVYLDSTQEYDTQDIIYPTVSFLGTKKIRYINYTLIKTKSIAEHSALPEFNEGGSYKTIIGGVYKFSNENGDVHYVEIAKKAKVFTLSRELLTLSKSDSYIKILRETEKSTFIPINNYSSDTIIDDSSTLPVRMIKQTKTLQNGRVWKLWNDIPSGMKVLIWNEEYAVIDFLKNQKIYLNKSFSISLTEAEKDYIVLLMLSIYEFYRSVENKNETVWLEK